MLSVVPLPVRGIDCLVFEAAEKIEPLGVGINLLPHGVKVLSALDLLDELLAAKTQVNAPR